MRIRDLGPLLVERAGQPRPVGGALAAILTALLIGGGRPVSSDTLAEAIWGDGEPRSASTLTSHLSRLRSLLGGEVLTRTSAGLVLTLPADGVDSRRFAALVEQVGARLAAGDPTGAVDRANEAAALWRGRPFEPLSDQPWAAPAVARLEELQAQLRERYVDALLGVGDAQRALVELRIELPARPLREHLWAQRMLAEYRTGRLDDALRSFHQARRLFLDELGVEPPTALVDLQARILAGDPALAGPATRAVPGTAGRAPDDPAPAPTAPTTSGSGRAATLPNRRGRLIGRDDLLESLQVLLRRDRLVTLAGAAGCGKTRLAVEIARAAAAEFPDGVWWVDLTAAQAADQVVDAVVSTIGLAAPRSGTAEDALIGYAAARRLLLVLDNCEQVVEPVARLVDDLLAAADDVRVLATSREPLDVDGEVVRTVPPLPVSAPRTTDRGTTDRGAAPAPATDRGAAPVTPATDPADAPATDPAADRAHRPADEPALPAAVELFVERLAAATGADLTADDLAMAEAICRSVDGVPLAVELAAARARAYSLAEIAQQVAADPSSLARIGRGGADHHRTVRYAIEQTYRGLTADEAALHRAVSVLPGPFTVGPAAALDSRPVAQTTDLVAGLVHRSMLAALGPARPGGPSRFAQLATVRGHATHAAAGRHDELVARRDRWVRQLVTGRPRHGRSTERDWLATVDDDLVAVRAALQHRLVDRPDPAGIRLVSGLAMYWYYRGMVIEGARWMERAVDVADRADPTDRALARLALAGSRTMAQRPEVTRPLVRAALAAVPDTAEADATVVGDAIGVLLGALGLAREEQPLRDCADLLRGLARTADNDGRLTLLADLGETLADLASPAPRPQVATSCAALWFRAQDLDDQFTSRLTSGTVAILALGAGDPDQALLWSDRQIASHVALGLTEGPVVLEVRANLLAQLGDAAGALRLYAAGQAHHRRVGLPWPQQPWTPDLQRRASAQLTPAEAAAAAAAGASLTLADVLPSAQPVADR